MTQFGLEQYCVDDTEITPAKLIEIFDEINNNLDAIYQKEEDVGSRLYTQARKDFAGMISRFTGTG